MTNSGQHSRDGDLVLAQLGANQIAYIRKISASDFMAAFPEIRDVQPGENYWGLFAADGQPIALSHDKLEITAEAFHNDLVPILPN